LSEKKEKAPFDAKKVSKQLSEEKRKVRAKREKEHDNILGTLKAGKGQHSDKEFEKSATALTLRNDKAKIRNASKDPGKDPAEQKRARELEAKEADKRTKKYLAELDALKFPALQTRAKKRGIKLGELKKPELIEQIQIAESKL